LSLPTRMCCLPPPCCCACACTCCCFASSPSRMPPDEVDVDAHSTTIVKMEWEREEV
jgi:hypothetical protein